MIPKHQQLSYPSSWPRGTNQHLSQHPVDDNMNHCLDRLCIEHLTAVQLIDRLADKLKAGSSILKPCYTTRSHHPIVAREKMTSRSSAREPEGKVACIDVVLLSSLLGRLQATAGCIHDALSNLKRRVGKTVLFTSMSDDFVDRLKSTHFSPLAPVENSSSPASSFTRRSSRCRACS